MNHRLAKSHFPHSRQYVRSQYDASAFAALIGSGKGIAPLVVGIGSGMESSQRRIHPTNLSLHHSGECLALNEPIPASNINFNARRSMSAREYGIPIALPPVRERKRNLSKTFVQQDCRTIIALDITASPFTKLVAERYARHLRSIHRAHSRSCQSPDKVRTKTGTNTVNFDAGIVRSKFGTGQILAQVNTRPDSIRLTDSPFRFLRPRSCPHRLVGENAPGDKSPLVHLAHPYCRQPDRGTHG